MIDPMAGLVAAGAAKSSTLEPVEGELLDAPGLSAPKRALLDAAEEVLGLVTGGMGRLPWAAQAAVSMMLRQVQGGMLATAVASMDEEEVRRLITEVRDRAAAALDG